MITAEQLKKLTSLKKDAVVGALESARETPSWAYAIKKIKFLGITNGGQFCYEIGYQDIDLAGQGLTFCKVFVDLDEKEEPVAEY